MIIMKLKERIKSLSGNVKEEKIKRELEKIETISIELDHRVTKLVAENEHLKQTYKKLCDSIKSSRVRSKEQCDDLIKQVNIKSTENSNLNASLQKKVLVITALKETLSKLKGKAVVNEAVTLHPIDPLQRPSPGFGSLFITSNIGAINHLARQGLVREVDISHETSVARSPQQNDVVERRNRTLIEAARTILITALIEMTSATISLGLVQKPSSSTPYVPPSRNDWDLLFQPMFDKLLNPLPSVDPQAPEVIALIVDTIPERQSSVIPQDVEEDIHDIEVVHMGNDLLFSVPIPEVTSA
nr:hypothetical protein [Tanacetum cinerariifolium]